MHSRQKMILEMLQKYQHLTLHDTAEKFNVTEMTIRRDFRELESQELLIQTKKGATIHPAQYEPDYILSSLTEEKFRLANALYDRLFPCKKLFIGTGITCLAFAKTIARRNLLPNTVITHSLSVASALFRSRSRVILLGGELRTSSMDLVGSVAEKNLEEYHVDWLVSGCDGASADYGFYTSDVRLSNLEKKTISIADHVAIITENRKFQCRSLTRFASKDKVDLLVTEAGLCDSDKAKLQKFNIEMIEVPNANADYPKEQLKRGSL